MDVYSFEFKGQSIDLTFDRGFVASAFEKNGKNYGSKIKLPSRGVMDIVSVTTLLIINAIESLEKINENIS